MMTRSALECGRGNGPKWNRFQRTEHVSLRRLNFHCRALIQSYTESSDMPKEKWPLYLSHLGSHIITFMVQRPWKSRVFGCHFYEKWPVRSSKCLCCRYRWSNLKKLLMSAMQSFLFHEGMSARDLCTPLCDCFESARMRAFQWRPPNCGSEVFECKPKVVTWTYRSVRFRSKGQFHPWISMSKLICYPSSAVERANAMNFVFLRCIDRYTSV